MPAVLAIVLSECGKPAGGGFWWEAEVDHRVVDLGPGYFAQAFFAWDGVSDGVQGVNEAGSDSWVGVDYGSVDVDKQERHAH